MSKLIVVSNRLPVHVSKKEGKFVFRSSSGGLATGISSIKSDEDMVWVGWPGIISRSAKAKTHIREELAKNNLVPVFLTQNKVEKYYEGFSNRTIWPLFHYFSQHVVYDDVLWRAYESVNHAFATIILDVYEPGDKIWVHDYQLLLLPGILRQHLPEAAIGFFLHIPFPSFELFRTLPWRQQLLDGLLGADLVGFHTFDYVRHFLSALLRLRGLEHEMNTVKHDNRHIRIESFPMGINYDKYADGAVSRPVQKYLQRFPKPHAERKIIVSVDRLDYSKGLLQRLEALYLFLKEHPEYEGKVEYSMLVVPSRSKVESYRLLKKRIDELVGRINGEFGTMDWTPVQYFYRALPFHALMALYRYADIGLVTPFRDGMNLVAKEFVATRHDKTGVLILSEMAGAANELGGALLVNPNDVNSIAQAIKHALEMPVDEQKQRLERMQRQISRYTVEKWADDFMTEWHKVLGLRDRDSTLVLTPEKRETILENVATAENALLILDYDGTLVPFVAQPDDAKPSDDLKNILRTLNTSPHHKVVIVSGRNRESLDTFFADLDIDIIAEHGAWFGRFDGTARKWTRSSRISGHWKDEILNILEQYVMRTPGSFVEEKDFSLVWHYRQSDIGLGRQRAHEMTETLSYITANLNLQVLEGAKVVEIKNASMNKGRAVQQLEAELNPDFILVAGDDWTDEDMFKALPDSCSLKVGLEQSAAQYNVKTSEDIVSLLQQITERI